MSSYYHLMRKLVPFLFVMALLCNVVILKRMLQGFDRDVAVVVMDSFDLDAKQQQHQHQQQHQQQRTQSAQEVETMIKAVRRNEEESGRRVIRSSSYSGTTSTTTSTRQGQVADGDDIADFTIVVLTMNRLESLKRLLASLSVAHYEEDRIDLVIRIDRHEHEQQLNGGIIDYLEKGGDHGGGSSFQWPHGHLLVTLSDTQRGLAGSWFDAWTPSSEEQRQRHFIILEDDIEVSPHWYYWVSNAWKTYRANSHYYHDTIAGISLQRQTLIPQTPSKTQEIVNNHEPFLYKLVGSIGFSPHPQQWTQFLHWIHREGGLEADVSTPGLITSDWWNALDKGTMWTQHFIYFCEERGLYTLYINLPNMTTLGSHMREKGEHFGGGEGRDFELLRAVPLSKKKNGDGGSSVLVHNNSIPLLNNFPEHLAKYGWDGELITEEEELTIMPEVSKSISDAEEIMLCNPDDIRTDVSGRCCRSDFRATIDTSLETTKFIPGKTIMMEPSSIAMLCDLLSPTTRVLEWGSGGSSIFFSKYVRQWDSVEHDATWVKEMVALSKDIPNLNVYSAQHSWDNVGDGTLEQFEAYVKRPGTIATEDGNDSSTGKNTWDVIIVDGRARVECARMVLRNNWLTDNGVVIVHEWERPAYKVLLDDYDLMKEDTSGPRHLGMLTPKPESERVAVQLESAGSEYGGWTYNAWSLSPSSVVYSVGIGEDTSWDEGILQKYGCQVWGFDPTPKAIAYVQGNTRLGDNFHLVTEGLSTMEGKVNFTMPANKDHVSMREGSHAGLGDVISVNVNTLENFMERFGHSHLDILKIDIEGSEYQVLEDLITRGYFPFDQLLVEWHDRFFTENSPHNRVIDGLKEAGFEVIHEKNGGQEMALLRRKKGLPPKELVSGMATSGIVVERATSIATAGHGYVIIQLLNEGYIEMAKSWVCNVLYIGNFDIIEKILFVATDQASYDALTHFNPSLHVVFYPFNSQKKDLDYGTYEYYSLMLFRTALFDQLLDANLTIWLVESDEVWLADPSNVVLETSGDIVTMSDSKPPKKIVCGGFLLLRPTERTRNIWKRLYGRFQERMKDASSHDHLGDSGSEQLMMDRLINETDANVTVSWLPPELFVPGIYYEDPAYADTVQNPLVIHNNYIIGNEAKTNRAKEWDYWFLSEDGLRCHDPQHFRSSSEDKVKSG